MTSAVVCMYLLCVLVCVVYVCTGLRISSGPHTPGGMGGSLGFCCCFFLNLGGAFFFFPTS